MDVVRCAAKNQRAVLLRRFQEADVDALAAFLNSLSAATQKRFAPHGYDSAAIAAFYLAPASRVTGFVAIDELSNAIIAYAVLNEDFQNYEIARFATYGIRSGQVREVLYAPSVADEWHNAGLGYALFQQVLKYCKGQGIRRIFLWGGVQADNEKAIAFYKRNGFLTIGRFEHQGWNWDMMCWIK